MQVPELQERFFIKAVQPYSWFAAVLLFLSYIIGLWFTLRTHAAIIWTGELEEKKSPAHLAPHSHDGSQQRLQGLHPSSARQGQTAQTAHKGSSVRDSPLYSRILGQSLAQVGLSSPKTPEEPAKQPEPDGQIPHVVPPNGTSKDARSSSSEFRVPGLSDEQNKLLVRRVTEVAATAATVAARDATKTKKPNAPHQTGGGGAPGHSKPPGGTGDATPNEQPDESAAFGDQHHASAEGGHDAPNWSKTKSSAILLVATFAYAVIAEILVNTVDVVLESVDVDEKFLGITLFSLVPNTTEFLVSSKSYKVSR